MVQTRRKDDASFSNSSFLRRSTRETRERTIRCDVSDKDDEDFEPTSMSAWPLRARRPLRRNRATRIQYDNSLSHSLRSRDVPDSDSEEESRSDESIFQTSSRRSRSSRTARRQARSRRMHSADHAETSNDHNDLGLDEESVHREDDGIRRSSRRRTHPSWLLGDQTVRGYPSYNQNSKDTPSSEKGKGIRSGRLRDRHNASHEQDETSQAAVSNRGRSAGKRVTKEETQDESEEVENNKEEVPEDVEEEADHQDNGNTLNADDNVPKENSYRTRSRKEKDTTCLNENFPDMYSRVKRTRRQMSSSESDESDTEAEQPSWRTSGRESTRRPYQLRVNKPTVDRFQAHHEPVRRPQRGFPKVLRNSVLRHLGRRAKSCFAPGSSSSSSDEKARYDHKKTHSRHVPHNYHPKDGVKAGGPQALHTKDGRPATLADIDPMALDTSIRFKNVGGLEEHIHCLQEMVVFPMLYKEVFEKFHITPPKGVLFHGPPGTGKTLIARALANECSQGDRKVSFFMRKGADCLSKWVGESERQLRLLFEQAYQMKPSIIFFDEIDGLAPVRSSKQDQIHASIVSTLLALMDGLDNRGDVIVIGATNRIDAIDPALRRPGRFDRELYFPLPACKERQEILKIHMNQWEEKPDDDFLSKLAEQSSGYCGSDLRALCTESVIQALRRTYPQIYKSSQRLLLNASNVKVGSEDFALARSSIIPAAHRVSASPARKLPSFLEPLLRSNLEKIIVQMKDIFPHGLSRDKNSCPLVHRPRFLIVGSSAEQAQTTYLAPALLHHMEHIPVYTLDLGSMYEFSARSPEETVSQVFQEARRNPPSIVYLPGIGQWWDVVQHTVQSVFLMQIQKLDMHTPVLLLATSDAEVTEIPAELSCIFSSYRDEVCAVSNPGRTERENFFRPLLLEKTLDHPKPPKISEENWEELPIAPPPEPAKLTEEELEKLYAKEEYTLRELRIFLREVCAKLARNRLFFMFSKPVDVEEAPDYYDIIEKPMDLETMMTRIDQHQYVCAKEFLNDIDLICRNALEYNPERDQADKLIRHRACFLRDSAYALIKAEMDTDFEDRCRTISEDRKKRKCSPSRYAPAPDFIHTTSSFNNKGQTANGNKDGTSMGSRINGDVSSHSSVASNSGALLNNSMSARKRRTSSWSRGCLGKPKKKKVSEDGHHHDKQDATAVDSEQQTPGADPPLSPSASPVNQNHSLTDRVSKENSDSKEAVKSLEDNPNCMKVNGNCDGTHSDVEMNSVEAKSSACNSKGGSKSPVGAGGQEDKDVLANKCDLSEQDQESSCGQVKKYKVSIEITDLKKFLTEVVKTTEKCSVEKLTELYIRLEKKIFSFSDEWDRSFLPLALQSELQRFKTFSSST